MNDVLNELLAKYGVDTKLPSGVKSVQRVARRSRIDLAEQEMIGQPGTVVYSGQIFTEPTAAYAPYYVRGASGDHGIYEEHCRSEPLIADAVQGHTETVVQGTVQLQAPENLADEDRERVEEFIAFHGSKMARWLPAYMESGTTSCLKYGFTVQNTIWGGIGPRERLHIYDVRYYEPNTVDKWAFNERMDTLVGASFRTTGQGPTEWYVPALGKTLLDRRLVLANLAAQGNNVEGVSPMRSSINYVKAKQLLVQISIVAAEKYGVPIAIVRDSGGTGPGRDATAIRADVIKLVNALRYQQSVDAHVASLPPGITLEFVGPAGTMPDFQGLIAYCDTMIAMTYSVEGSLLGLQSSVGSYALSEVKERDTLRSAPYYARRVLAPLNELIHELAVAELGALPEYPKLVWRMDTATDDGAWLQRALDTFGGPIETWPEAAQKVGLQMLDLPPDTYSSTEQEEADSVGFAECAHDHYGFAEAETAGLESIMDEVEAELAAELATLQRNLQADWKVLIRDNESSADLIADRATLKAKYEPLIRAAVVGAMADAARRAGQAYLDSLGSTATYSLDLTGEIELLAVSAVDETLNRMVGVMTDSEVERLRGGTAQTVATLTFGSLLAIAARLTSSAINRARDGVVAGLAQQAGLTRPIVAERSAILDSRSCATCRKLDGRKAQVGSAAYRALTPPNGCEGRERCRCVWVYALPFADLAAAGVISEQAAAERTALEAL